MLSPFIPCSSKEPPTAISATPAEGQRTRKICHLSWVWAQKRRKPASVLSRPCPTPPLLLRHTPCVGLVGLGVWSAPRRGPPSLHRNRDQIFQNHTQVTGSLCAAYKACRMLGNMLWMMRFLWVFGDVLPSFPHSRQGLLQSHAWGRRWARAGLGSPGWCWHGWSSARRLLVGEWGGAIWH